MSDFLPPDQRSPFYQGAASYYKNNPLSPEQQKKLQEEQQERLRQQELKRQQQQQQQQYQYQQQNPYAQNPNVRLEATPNAIGSLVCGIFSLFFTVTWLWWYGTVLGMILACLTLYMSNSGMQMIETSPHVFSRSGFGNLRAAKIMAIISLAIAGLSFIGLVMYFSLVAETADSGQWQW